ncbi:MAG: sodium-dependent transporter [Gemmatimonadota bacterium]
MRPGGRATFGSRFGTLAVMVGVAAGLGNVWRFPYMAGRFGGSAFVLVYVLAVLLIGIPALVAEWTLGRHTRRGTVGAFEKAGLPGGRQVGWLYFGLMGAAVGYYTAVLGWVVYHAAGQVAAALGLSLDAAAILPPAAGFDLRSFLLQAACTGLVLLACALVLLKGLRRGIEVASRWLTPFLFLALFVLILRAVTLPSAMAGIDWYILRFDPGQLSGRVVVAALGQAVFSLSLGGTFMVAYGSYLNAGDDLRSDALWTASGDTLAGLLAGLAIFPAVFALGLEPDSGPSLLFSTLPGVFDALPAGWLFGLLFFAGLFGAAYLSDIAGLEVMIAGLVDNTRLDRRQAVWLAVGLGFLVSLPPTLNTRIFVPWDLTFGSGAQTVGVLLAVLTVGWAMRRADVLRELMAGAAPPARSAWRSGAGWWLRTTGLYVWIRYVIPIVLLLVGAWWLLTDVLGIVRPAG